MALPPITVLERRARWVVVDKPSGLSVHRGWDASRDNAMMRARDQLGAWVYPAHRLDRGTSGALVLALDEEAASALGARFMEGAVEKEYIALVRGVIEAPVTLDRALHRERGSEERLDARTEVEPLALVRDRYTLVRARPRTGRLHQIRRHLKHFSRPILGDTQHGDRRENRAFALEVGLARMALHASRIAMRSPLADEPDLDVSAPLPPDLGAPLVALGFDRDLLATLGYVAE